MLPPRPEGRGQNRSVMNAPSAPPTAPAPATELEAILDIVRARTMVDFSLYRTATMRRRIQNRMVSLGVTRLDQYLELLAASRSEHERLLERLTVKVSRFYRNAPVFDRLRREVIPRLARGGRRVRVWCAGCARGEEAYTLAMLIAEAGGVADVLATDIDPVALSVGRLGVFDAAATPELPPDLRQRYLVPVDAAGARFEVAPPAMRGVRFALHDLASGRPPAGEAGFQLVSCRNVLIYFRPCAQRDVLRTLLARLVPGGYLCLGEAEWLPPDFEPRFEVVSRQARLFRAAAAPPVGLP